MRMQPYNKALRYNESYRYVLTENHKISETVFNHTSAEKPTISEVKIKTSFFESQEVFVRQAKLIKNCRGVSTNAINYNRAKFCRKMSFIGSSLSPKLSYLGWYKLGNN